MINESINFVAVSMEDEVLPDVYRWEVVAKMQKDIPGRYFWYIVERIYWKVTYDIRTELFVHVYYWHVTYWGLPRKAQYLLEEPK